MTSGTRIRISTAAASLALLLGGAPTLGAAQSTTPPMKTPPHQDGMSAMHGTKNMMMGPHHALARAYGENLSTFARVVQRQASRSTSVDVDLARPAVVEMRRSFDQMQQHHTAHVSMMGDGMKSTMGTNMKVMAGAGTKSMVAMMQQMETHLTSLTEHLTALETEVNASVPSPKSVLTHTDEILRHCATMSGMMKRADAKPQQRK